jgi:hypothetical protein
MARGLGTKGRFAVAYLAMGAAVGTGLGTFVVLLQRSGPQPPPAWSSWQPGSTSLNTQVLEIADHVGTSYRLASGDQLTSVRVGGPLQNKSVKAIVVPTKAQPKTMADFKPYEKSKSIVYILCGAGRNCKISEGTPSQSRGTVLRREALELALYTLEYNHGVDNVLVFVPPGPGENRLTSTLFFHRSDLSSHLKHPLRTTLPHRPPVPGKIAATEQRTVDDLTGSNISQYVGIVTANGYGDLLVIKPTT